MVKCLFYVDDSVIFTDGINDIKDFGNKIDEINSEIKNLTEKLYKIKKVGCYMKKQIVF